MVVEVGVFLCVCVCMCVFKTWMCLQSRLLGHCAGTINGAEFLLGKCEKFYIARH